MKDADDLDLDDDINDDLLDDDDTLDSYAQKGGGAATGSTEERLAAKYADYLMWTDTGSSHDEALDLASMTEEEYTDAERADSAERSDSVNFDDEDDDLDDEDEGYSPGRSGGKRGGEYDSDDY